ncbi:hypothetical protein [Bdellovibrio sp. HCB288]|uniref:hypothetical protein n=1 Tax=Bdellovibrio sp. HCB288 TaxID=3394355 RepID=UPI0039B5189C
MKSVFFVLIAMTFSVSAHAGEALCGATALDVVQYLNQRATPDFKKSIRITKASSIQSADPTVAAEVFTIEALDNGYEVRVIAWDADSKPVCEIVGYKKLWD